MAKCVIKFVITCATKCVVHVCDKVCATKCVRQSVSDKVCSAKCVRQSVQQSARQGVRQSVRQSVLNIHLHTKAKGVQYTTGKVCDPSCISKQQAFQRVAAAAVVAGDNKRHPRRSGS